MKLSHFNLFSAGFVLCAMVYSISVHHWGAVLLDALLAILNLAFYFADGK